jgi:hypothetical protein
MPDAKTKSFAQALMKEQPPANDTERQIGIQAFTLRVKYSNGRRVEGFSWHHYAGYEWDGEGEKEKLTLLFGMRAVVVEGYRLQNLLREIDDGRRRTLKEMSDTEARLALNTPEENEPVITRITAEPSFLEVIKELKGEATSATKTGFTERFGR